jgi:hypothetical protein
MYLGWDAVSPVAQMGIAYHRTGLQILARSGPVC